MFAKKILRSKKNRILIPLVFSLFSFSTFAAETSKTLIVYPLHNGTLDVASDKAAEMLRSALGQHPELKIVSPENVETVVDYYRGYQLSKNTSDVEEIKNWLHSAKEHYFQLEYKETASELTQIIDRFEMAPQLQATDGELLIDAWVFSGLLSAAKQKKAEAVVAFEKVLKLNSNYPINPENFAPSILRLFQKARENIQPQCVGSIRIEGVPKVADIFLNGVYRGVSPLILEKIPLGEHKLSIRAHRYSNWDQDISIKNNEPIFLNHRLVWQNKIKSEDEELKIFSSRKEIEFGLKVAELLKVDKVFLVNLEEEGIHLRLIDREFRTSHRPIFLPLTTDPLRLQSQIDEAVQLGLSQLHADLRKRPQKQVDPIALADPILLGEKRRTISKGVLWGGIGALSAGGIIAAILSATGSKTPNTATLQLNLQ